MSPSHSPPIFGVDVDGVLADLVQPLLHQVFLRTGTQLLPTDITRFDLASILGREGWSVARDALAAPGFALHLPVIDGAREGIEALRALGRVVFVTAPFSPSPTWAHDRASWLNTHFRADAADIVSLTDKTLFRGDLLVDDSPAQLDAWTRSGRPAIRIAHPWNTGAPGLVAQSWDDVLRHIEALAQPPRPGPQANID